MQRDARAEVVGPARIAHRRRDGRVLGRAGVARRVRQPFGGARIAAASASCGAIDAGRIALPARSQPAAGSRAAAARQPWRSAGCRSVSRRSRLPHRQQAQWLRAASASAPPCPPACRGGQRICDAVEPYRRGAGRGIRDGGGAPRDRPAARPEMPEDPCLGDIVAMRRASPSSSAAARPSCSSIAPPRQCRVQHRIGLRRRRRGRHRLQRQDGIKRRDAASDPDDAGVATGDAGARGSSGPVPLKSWICVPWRSRVAATTRHFPSGRGGSRRVFPRPASVPPASRPRARAARPRASGSARPRGRRCAMRDEFALLRQCFAEARQEGLEIAHADHVHAARRRVLAKPASYSPRYFSSAVSFCCISTRCRSAAPTRSARSRSVRAATCWTTSRRSERFMRRLRRGRIRKQLAQRIHRLGVTRRAARWAASGISASPATARWPRRCADRCPSGRRRW